MPNLDSAYTVYIARVLRSAAPQAITVYSRFALSYPFRDKEPLYKANGSLQAQVLG